MRIRRFRRVAVAVQTLRAKRWKFPDTAEPIRTSHPSLFFLSVIREQRSTDIPTSSSLKPQHRNFKDVKYFWKNLKFFPEKYFCFVRSYQRPVASEKVSTRRVTHTKVFTPVPPNEADHGCRQFDAVQRRSLFDDSHSDDVEKHHPNFRIRRLPQEHSAV